MNLSSKQRIFIAGVIMGIICGCAAEGPVPVRDVAGVRNLSRDGHIYIAGTPTPDSLDHLKARGVTTIIDFRKPEEGTEQEAAEARRRGLNYVNIPMNSDQMTPEQARQLLDAMSRHKDEGVLMHCAGASRAGAMYGLYLGAGGQCSIDEAVRRAEAAGLRNDKLKKDLEENLRRAGSVE